MKEKLQDVFLAMNNRKKLGFLRFNTSRAFITSLFIAGFMFSTAIESSAQVSYTQDFETGISSWSTNWSMSTLTPCGGLQSPRKNIYTLGTQGDFVSPSLGTSNGGVVTMSFSYKMINYSGGGATPATFGTINVQQASSASGPWTTIHTINSSNHTPSTTCATVNVPAFSPPNGPLFIRYNCLWGTGDYYLYFDDISISQGAAPACAGPSLLTAAPTSTGASVNWTENGSATSWNVQYGLAGFTLGSGTTVTTGTKPYSITGLTANTAYSYYVRADCGVNGTSVWAGPFTFTTLCSSQLSGTITLDPALPASSTNFVSFAALQSELAMCGVSGPLTVHVKQGTYTGKVDFSGSYVGSSTINVVTIKANPTNTMPVVVTYAPTSSATTENYTLNLTDVSNLKFEDITFESTGTTYSRVVQIGGSCSNITFNNNIFNGAVTTSTSTFNAIFYYGTGMIVDGLTVSNSTLNNGSSAFYLVGSSTNGSNNLVLSDNTFSSTYYAAWYGGYWKNITITGNTVDMAASSTTQYGFYFYGTTSATNTNERAIVEKNKLNMNTTSTLYGIYTQYYLATPGVPSSIANNFISNSTTTGTGTRYMLYPYGVANMNVYHNTVSLLDGSATAARALYVGTTTAVSAGNLNIKNNIFSVANGYAVEILSTAATIISSMNNNIFNYALSNTTPLRSNSVNYANRAAWNLATTFDANSLEGDPLFLSPSDLHVFGTLANDAGDNTAGVSTDIDNQARPASGSTIVDIGADEYTPASCVPPTGLTAIALTGSSATITWVTGGASNWRVQYGPTGFTLGSGTKISASNDTITLTGLSALTTYDVYVKDSCSATSKSIWSSSATFTTYCASQISGTVTIDGSLPASSTNYQSFADLLLELNTCGVGGPLTVNVKEGTYTGKLDFGSYVGASATNTITIQANPANTMPVVLTYAPTSSATSENYTIQLSGSEHLHFADMTIQSTGTAYSRVVQMGGTCNDIEFDNIIFDAPVQTSTSTFYATFYYLSPLTFDGFSITNSTFNNNSYGLYLLGGSSPLSDNFVFEGNTMTGFNGYGIYMTYVKNASIKNNTMTSIASTSTQYGVYLSGTTSIPNERLVFEGNNIMMNTTSTFYGIYAAYYVASSTMPSKMVNNMILNAATAGTSTRYGIYPYACGYLDIYHNSISILDGSTTATRALYLNTTTSVTGAGNLNIKNNIFSVAAAGYAIEISSSATSYVSSMDYNIFNYDVVNNTNPLRYNNSNYTGLAGWQLATLFDANSYEGDPNFFSPTDLHVFGALANDVGDNSVGVTTDIDGQSRPIGSSTIVDIGADEYTPAACTPPINAAATNLLATSADLSWNSTNGTPTGAQIEWGATGFTQGAGTTITIVGTDSTYVLTGLTAQTTYDFYLRDKCILYSAWVGPFTFTTPCAAFSAPFMENFDSLALTSPYTALPPCWEPQTGPDYWDVTNDVVNNGHTYLPNIGDHTSGTTNYMWIDASSNITPNEMVTPLIDMSSLTTPYAGFWFASDNTTNSTNHTIALDVWDGTAWVNVTTERGNFTGWVEVAGPVPSGVPTTSKFRIYAIADSGTTSSTYFQNDLGVDDFFVVEAPSCFAPTMFTAYNATTTSIDLAWIGGGAANFNLEYGAVGFTPGAGTYLSSTNDTTTISGLTPATLYDVYVRDSCGTGDVSAWVGPLSFSTLVCPTTNQCWFTVNMTDSYGDGWNGALLSFRINGIEVDEVGSIFTSGSTAVDSVSLCNMDSVEIVVKNQGSYPTEVGFSVLDPQGAILFTRTNGSGFSTGVTLGTIYAQCAAPACPVTDVPVVAAQTSCGPSPVTFTATGNTKPNTQGYFWMRSSDSVIVSLNNPFTTPAITANTTWYAGIGTINDTSAMQHVVPDVVGTTGGYGNFTNGMFFTAIDFFYLDSVTVRANGPLSFVIRISEPIPGASGGAGAQIMLSDTIVIPAAGDYQIPVDLAFSPGDYFMNMSVIPGSGTGALFRTTTGAVYPYTIPGLVSVTGVNIASPRIYYFFDWVVSGVCVSSFTAANAIYAPVPSTALPYAENFNVGTPCNWSTDAASTGADWMNVANYGGTNSIDATNFMFIDDDAPGSSAITQASLVSPVFNAIGYDTLFIEFDHYFYALGASAGHVEVYDGTTWQSVYTATGTSVGSWTSANHQAIDITMYQNPNLQVRFRYDDGGAYAWYWAVDNFELDGTLSSCQNVVVNIVTDIFGSETTWSITDTATGIVFASGGPYPDVNPYNAALATHIDTVCLPVGQFFEFRLEDSYGDGLVDGTNTGTYNVDIICTWGNNNVIFGSGLFPYGSTTNPPNYDSTVFEVTCLVPCSDPDSLAATAGCTTADLTWDSETNATSTVEWGASGFTPGSGTMVYGATSPLSLTGLANGTAYDFYVIDTCQSGTSSMLVGPVTFTTDSLPTINATATLVSSGTTVTYDFTASGTGIIYGWDFGDGGQDTGTAVTHIYTANGTYQVIVAAYNACGISFDTLTAVVTGIGIDEFGFGNIALYPNPNDGYFTITGLTNFGSDATIEVVNMAGAVIYRQKIVANSSESFVLDLRGYAPGVYQVRVSSEKGVGAKPFVLRN